MLTTDTLDRDSALTGARVTTMLSGDRPALLEVCEQRWCVSLKDRVVRCTIHRSDTGFGVLAGNGLRDLLRVAYTGSLSDARNVADQWLRALLAAGFRREVGPDDIVPTS